MELAAKWYGEGRITLVVLHGLLGCADNWKGIARRLSDACRIACVDMRNHGDSPHSPTMTYPEMAADVCEFVERHGLQNVVLLGHSMGGKVAMQVAGQCGRCLSGLIVVDIAPRAYQFRHRRAIDALTGVHPEDHETRRSVDDALAQRVPTPGLRAFLLKGLATTADGTLRWRANVAALEHAYAGIMDNIPTRNGFDGPTLVVRGEKSDYIRDCDVVELRQRYPRARVVTLAQASHWVQADVPEAFCTEIHDFLETVETGQTVATCR